MNVADIVKEFGYTTQWLEWGIVDEAYLRAQYAEYFQSDDKNQEHYRARAFHDFLSRRVQLTDETVDCIFRLTDEGPDGCDLTTNRIIELIVGGLLTDEQHFALAGHHPIVRQPPIERCYDRASLLIKIRRTGLAANFSDVQACADSVIHLNLLEHPELAREHLEWLASAGANKSIRNRAQSMLRSKRFREL